MSADAVRRAFAHRVRALALELPGALEDDVEALHRSRVASRRLREILPVLGVDGALAGGDAPVRSRVRRLTRSLGGVRELDVSLGILDELAARHPGLSAVLAAVRQGVAEERRVARDAMIAEVEQIGGLKLPDELERLSSRIATGPAARAARVAALSSRLERRADRLETAVDGAGSLYVPERLHEVRIAAKQLRYALELVHEFGSVGTRRQTARVKQFQDLLGRLHDLEILSSRVRQYAWAGRTEHAEHIGRLHLAIDREIRECHADYLAGAYRLHDVVAACRATIQPRLAAARGKGRRAGGTP
jgi:CHAD domain-containing protein